MTGNTVMTQARRAAGVGAWGHGFRSELQGLGAAGRRGELLSEFARPHVEDPATAAAYARDDLLEKRRPVIQMWTDCISENAAEP
ncbi:MAG: hypothetical protein OXH15_05845 [Gammaproteobacteria bacterium]|nr:hypothetical protein [Gammaproteobacteria bacterium]